MKQMEKGIVAIIELSEKDEKLLHEAIRQHKKYGLPTTVIIDGMHILITNWKEIV